ncbi:MAG: hypothetical protein LRZ85_01235 [Alphaproteobacteria bacterium]|nr:hypothetical protein [Alphaproteobacteria bacterium]MCD8570816.1 hypothetical protein [Alphaproteobacteria bacterium]
MNNTLSYHNLTKVTELFGAVCIRNKLCHVFIGQQADDSNEVRFTLLVMSPKRVDQLMETAEALKTLRTELDIVPADSPFRLVSKLSDDVLLSLSQLRKEDTDKLLSLAEYRCTIENDRIAFERDGTRKFMDFEAILDTAKERTGTEGYVMTLLDI